MYIANSWAGLAFIATLALSIVYGRFKRADDIGTWQDYAVRMQQQQQQNFAAIGPQQHQQFYAAIPSNTTMIEELHDEGTEGAALMHALRQRVIGLGKSKQLPQIQGIKLKNMAAAAEEEEDKMNQAAWWKI